MSKIYLSYRRRDAAGYAGRLFDHLCHHFGPGSVFMDIDSITRGQDFAQIIETALNACDVVLVLIGSTWATSTGQDGRRRLDDPEDWVRLEVAAALRRNVLVIPVLVEGARIPDPTSLPEELRLLCRRNASELTDLRWSYDVGELVKDLEKTVGSAKKIPRAKNKRLRWLTRSITILVLLLGMTLFALNRNRPVQRNSVTSTPKTIQTSTASEVQAGSLAYKFLKADLSQYSVAPDGKPSKWALRCSIRITDVMSLSTWVTSDSFHLLVEGAELSPQNQISSQWVYAKGTMDTDALFIIPADVDRVELIVGQSKDATATIPIQTSLLPKPPPQVSTGSNVQAGSLAYKLLKADLSQYSVAPDGKPSKWALRCSIRITDVMSLSTWVTSDNFHLLVEGTELSPQNQISSQWVLR